MWASCAETTRRWELPHCWSVISKLLAACENDVRGLPGIEKEIILRKETAEIMVRDEKAGESIRRHVMDSGETS